MLQSRNNPLRLNTRLARNALLRPELRIHHHSPLDSQASESNLKRHQVRTQFSPLVNQADKCTSTIVWTTFQKNKVLLITKHHKSNTFHRAFLIVIVRQLPTLSILIQHRLISILYSNSRIQKSSSLEKHLLLMTEKTTEVVLQKA